MKTWSKSRGFMKIWHLTLGNYSHIQRLNSVCSSYDNYKNNCSFYYFGGNLKSGAYGHQQILSFFPSDALPGPHCCHLPLPLVSFFLPLLLSSIAEKLLSWIEIRSPPWPLKNILFLCLQKVLSCFWSMLRVLYISTGKRYLIVMVVLLSGMRWSYWIYKESPCITLATLLLQYPITSHS